MVWYGHDGSTREIYLYTNGDVKKISDDSTDYFNFKINDLGQVFWLGHVLQGEDEIYLFASIDIERITDDDNIYRDPQNNNLGQVVWWSGQAFDTEIYLYNHGTIQNISNNHSVDKFPQINDRGQIIFYNTDMHLFLANPLTLHNSLNIAPALQILIMD